MVNGKVVIEELEGIYEAELANLNGKTLVTNLTIQGSEKSIEFAIMTSESEEELYRNEDLQAALDVFNA